MGGNVNEGLTHKPQLCFRLDFWGWSKVLSIHELFELAWIEEGVIILKYNSGSWDTEESFYSVHSSWVFSNQYFSLPDVGEREKIIYEAISQ